jgi:hypothetical protein
LTPLFPARLDAPVCSDYKLRASGFSWVFQLAAAHDYAPKGV